MSIRNTFLNSREIIYKKNNISKKKIYEINKGV